MDEATPTALVIPAGAVPEQVRAMLEALAEPALLASLELLDDGRLVIQVLPGVDPRFVARVRVMMAQHEDVLRRLS